MYKKQGLAITALQCNFVQISDIDGTVIQCYHVATTKEKTKSQTEREEKEMTMTIDEMKEYIIDELLEERKKLLMNQPNHYGYLYMIANDMGLIEDLELSKYIKSN